jgi:chromosome partitioning protein
MTKIYAFANQKGGVGKTTSVVNIAAYIAESGSSVLVVDVDPQSNATSGLGFNKNEVKSSTYNLLIDDRDPESVMVCHEQANVFLLPGSPALSGAEVELVNLMAREFRLNSVLERLNNQFDYILIDCPPSLGLLTLNALTAAKDGVIVPVQCEYLALEGLSQLVSTIQLVRQHLNRRLRIRGLILTMYDGRTNLSRQVVNEVREHFPGQVFRAIIPRNVRLSEAPSFGQPINLYDPVSTGALAYKVLTAELLQGDNTRTKNR